MLRRELGPSNVSTAYWAEITMADGCHIFYSPMLQRFSFAPHAEIRGGWICEEMGLGECWGRGK